MADDDAVNVLNRLLELSRDARDGFLAAADAVNDVALKRLFTTYAHQRGEFLRELEQEVRRLGGTPQRRGSVAAALHRALMNVRAAVAGRDEHAVIAEAERGEAVAQRTYDEALARAGLRPEVRTVIARQAVRVKETRDSLRNLERAA